MTREEHDKIRDIVLEIGKSFDQLAEAMREACVAEGRRVERAAVCEFLRSIGFQSLAEELEINRHRKDVQ